MSSDRRCPLQPFSPNRIESFLGERKVLAARLMKGGRSSSNYLVELDSGEAPVVVRLYGEDDSRREAMILSIAKDLVPVPELIFQGENFGVFSFLEGTPLSKAPMFIFQAAKTLARIFTREFNIPGRIKSDGEIEPWLFKDGKGFVYSMLEKENVRTLLGAKRIATIENFLERMAPRFEMLARESFLVHGDFNPGNILINDGQVSGILDWEFAHSGTPFMDIGNLIRDIPEKNHGDVFAGLAAGGMHLPEDWKELARLVDFTSMIEFLSTSRADAFKEQCLEKIDEYLKELGAL